LQLPKHAARLSNLFSAIQSRKKEFNITDWGLLQSSTSAMIAFFSSNFVFVGLEDVLLQATGALTKNRAS
jgi:hypothetical protein